MSTLLASFSRRTFAQYLHRDGISYKIRHGLRKSVFNHQAICRRYCAVPHMAWQDIICHLLHLPARRAIYNNNRSPWYLLIHHNKMSLEIFHFHSPGFLPPFFVSFLPPLASSSFSSRHVQVWPLTLSSVADWALWDANWPCNNTSNRDILPCKMWGKHTVD